MIRVRGRERVKAFLAAVPEKMTDVLNGAAHAGADVFAEYIRKNTPSDTVRDRVVIRSEVRGTRISTTVDIKGRWARSIATWLEWGTEAHFVSVDDEQRRGRGLGRINQQLRENGGNQSLVIGGKFVGSTVWHPGTRPHPVIRPARDLMEGEAVAAAQRYIDRHISGGKILSPGAADE